MKHASSAWSATDAPDPRLRALYLALALLAALLLSALLAIVVIPDGRRAGAERFDNAERCIEPATIERFRREGLARILSRPLSAAPGCWQTVALPAIVPAQALVFDNDRPPLTRVWYRVRYKVPADWSPWQPIHVFLPRAMGWGWELRVDGRTLADNLDDWRMTWNRIVDIAVPPDGVRPGQTLTIDFLLVYVTTMGHALPTILVGPSQSVERTAVWRDYLQISMLQACTAVMVALSGFFFAFWLGRRDETTHLLLALAGIAWAVCDVQYVLPRHDDPSLEAWYDYIVTIAITWVMWLIYLIVLRLDPRRPPWVRRALPAYVLAVTVLTMPVWHFGTDVGLLFHTGNTTVATGVTALIVWLAIRGRTELRVIASTLVLALLAGAHDVALIGLAVTPESIFLLPYSSLLIFGAFLYAVQRRYLRAIDGYEQLSNSLSQRLAAREAELNANHLRLREFEREQALAGERQRLMHDMHDGVGSALLTTLAAVEDGQLSGAAVSAALRACIDDLRLVIDSLEPMEQDLVAVLATLRYRLGPRLEVAGLDVVWDMQNLPELHWLQAPDALNLLRLLQEALANTIKHARARRIRLATRSLGDQVQVLVEDDGCGFDPLDHRPGLGLRHMRRRAADLGGTLDVITAPGAGVCLDLRLPVRR